MSDPSAPAWLTQITAVLSAAADPVAAANPVAAARLRAALEQLERLDGRGERVPFTVIHDWHARTVAPMLAEAVARRGASPRAQHAVGELHARAAAGEPVDRAEWIAALEPALREVYRHAYPYADAYATARAAAHAYAAANGYSADGAVEFADSYARMNTDANVASYAEANATANAHALADAFAAADERAYAECHPFALVQACLLATAGDPGDLGDLGDPATARRRLADGLIESLARAGLPMADPPAVTPAGGCR